MANALYRTGNEVIIDTYAQKTAQRLGVNADAVRVEFRKAGRQFRPRTPAPAEEVVAAANNSTRPSVQEFWLLRLLLLDDENVEFIARHLAPDWLQHPSVRQIIEARLRAHDEGSWRSLANLLNELEEEEARRLVAEAVAEDRPIANRPRQIADLVKRLRDQAIDRHLTELARQVADPNLPETRRLELMREQRRLRLGKREPLAPRQ
jgi:hypothetical protein